MSTEHSRWFKLPVQGRLTKEGLSRMVGELTRKSRAVPSQICPDQPHADEDPVSRWTTTDTDLQSE